MMFFKLAGFGMTGGLFADGDFDESSRLGKVSSFGFGFNAGGFGFALVDGLL